MALKHKLKKDLAGENEAIKQYGSRKVEAAEQGKMKLAGHLAEIQGDERDHKRILTSSLKGIQNAIKK